MNGFKKSPLTHPWTLKSGRDSSVVLLYRDHFTLVSMCQLHKTINVIKVCV